MSKVFTIVKFHNDKEYEYNGTLSELTEIFSYTLLCGNSYNKKINMNPKTINGLISALNKSVKETQNGSWNPDYYELKK